MSLLAYFKNCTKMKSVDYLSIEHPVYIIKYHENSLQNEALNGKNSFLLQRRNVTTHSIRKYKSLLLKLD